MLTGDIQLGDFYIPLVNVYASLSDLKVVESSLCDSNNNNS